MIKLEKNNTALLIIDIQERLCDVMDEDMLDTVISNTSLLINSFNIMNIPIIETKQYPKGLGDTIDDIKDIINPLLTVEKTSFSVGNNNDVLHILNEKQIKNIVVVGMEAHICVLQTVIDLINNGFNVYVVADAVISKNDFSWETALDMMQKSNAYITVAETVIYQLIGDSSNKEFKEIHKLLK